MCRTPVKLASMAMTCPRCKSPLIDVQSQGSNLHFCGQCRGVWFDNNEFLYHLRVKTGAAELKWIENVSRSTHMTCPHCGSDLKETPFNVCLPSGCAQDPFLLIDYCGKCNGVWLDEGELQKAEALSKELPKLQENVFNALNDIRDNTAYKIRKTKIPFAAPFVAFAILFSFLMLYSKVALQSKPVPNAHPEKLCKSCRGAGKYNTACPTCRGFGKVSTMGASNVPCTLCSGSGHVSLHSGRCFKCSGSGWISGGGGACVRCKGSGRIPDSVKKSCASCYGTGHIQVKEICVVCGGSRKSTINSPFDCPGCNGTGSTMTKKTCPYCLAGIVETRTNEVCMVCRGSGHSSENHACDQCMGTGNLDASHDGPICSWCKGSGFRAITGPNTTICGVCSGTGVGSPLACRACEGKGVQNES